MCLRGHNGEIVLEGEGECKIITLGYWFHDNNSAGLLQWVRKVSYNWL
jgi:hypothetical protein